jgi:hypothetical protein
MLNGVLHAQHWQQRKKAFVLRVGEDIAVNAFEFDANGKIIALRTPQMHGFTCMPSAVVAACELP